MLKSSVSKSFQINIIGLWLLIGIMVIPQIRFIFPSEICRNILMNRTEEDQIFSILSNVKEDYNPVISTICFPRKSCVWSCILSFLFEPHLKFYEL